MSQVRTEDLFLAAFLRSLGATVVSYDEGRGGRGEVVLDTTYVTRARSTQEAEKLALQVSSLADSPTEGDAALVLNNTFLGTLAQYRAEMQKQILNRRRS